MVENFLNCALQSLLGIFTQSIPITCCHPDLSMNSPRIKTISFLTLDPQPLLHSTQYLPSVKNNDFCSIGRKSSQNTVNNQVHCFYFFIFMQLKPHSHIYTNLSPIPALFSFIVLSNILYIYFLCYQNINSMRAGIF